MFKFLKDKLKSAISKISEGVEKEGKAEEKIIEKPLEEKKEEKGFFAKLKEKFVGKEETQSAEKTKKNEPIEIEKETVEDKKSHIKKEAIEIHPKPAEHKKEEKHKAVDHKKEIQEKPKTELKKEIHIPATKKEEIFKHEEKIHKPAPTIEDKKEIKHEAKEEPKPEQNIKEKEAIPKAEIKPQETTKIPEEPEKKGFFARLTEKIITTTINEGQFEKLFWELELALMENNVAMEVIEKIKNDLKGQLVEKPIRRNKVEETISLSLKDSIVGLFQSKDIDLLQQIKNKNKKPYVITFFGINGSGKTTSIAKLAHMLKEKNISCVLAAGDTFRAASIEQLSLHAEKIGVKIIKHTYGSDPAAVAFDAIKHAKSKNIDVVLIDTAGRMHSNENLIQEMKKIIRVAKPDLKIFVGESITGNDCVEQAKTFNESVGIDGIILAKADIDEKGGAAVSVSYVTKKPILYLGVGQEYKDLEKFDSEVIMKGLGLD